MGKLSSSSIQKKAEKASVELFACNLFPRLLLLKTVTLDPPCLPCFYLSSVVQWQMYTGQQRKREEKISSKKDGNARNSRPTAFVFCFNTVVLRTSIYFILIPTCHHVERALDMSYGFTSMKNLKWHHVNFHKMPCRVLLLFYQITNEPSKSTCL